MKRGIMLFALLLITFTLSACNNRILSKDPIEINFYAVQSNSLGSIILNKDFEGYQDYEYTSIFFNHNEEITIVNSFSDYQEIINLDKSDDKLYDENFFKDNSLIIITKYLELDFTFELLSHSIEESKLTINIGSNRSFYRNISLDYPNKEYHFIFEVQKETIDEIEYNLYDQTEYITYRSRCKKHPDNTVYQFFTSYDEYISFYNYSTIDINNSVPFLNEDDFLEYNVLYTKLVHGDTGGNIVLEDIYVTTLDYKVKSPANILVAKFIHESELFFPSGLMITDHCHLTLVPKEQSNDVDTVKFVEFQQYIRRNPEN